MTSTGNLLLRNDTFFGVCQGLGEDFRFHPNWLRIAFASAFYFSPIGVISVYFGLGLLVAISRLVYRDRVAPVEATTDTHAMVSQASHREQEELPLAA